MTGTRSYNCKWCDREIVGYKRCRDHEYNCALNPRKKGDSVPEPSSVAELAQEALPEQVSEKPEEIIPEEPPALGSMPDNLANLIDARIGFRWTQLEQHLQEQFEKRDQGYGQQFKDAIGNLPAIIDQSVIKYLSGQTPATDANLNPPAPPAENPSNIHGNPSTGGFSLFGNQFNWQELAMEYLKAKGKGNPMAGLANLFLNPNKRSREVDSKYVSRGMGIMSTILRMKNSDPIAMALAFKNQGERFLKEPGLSSQQKDLYAGQISICDAFLQGQDLHKTPEPPPGE